MLYDSTHIKYLMLKIIKAESGKVKIAKGSGDGGGSHGPREAGGL